MYTRWEWYSVVLNSIVESVVERTSKQRLYSCVITTLFCDMQKSHYQTPPGGLGKVYNLLTFRTFKQFNNYEDRCKHCRRSYNIMYLKKHIRWWDYFSSHANLCVAYAMSGCQSTHTNSIEINVRKASHKKVLISCKFTSIHIQIMFLILRKSIVSGL